MSFDKLPHGLLITHCVTADLRQKGTELLYDFSGAPKLVRTFQAREFAFPESATVRHAVAFKHVSIHL